MAESKLTASVLSETACDSPRVLGVEGARLDQHDHREELTARPGAALFPQHRGAVSSPLKCWPDRQPRGFETTGRFAMPIYEYHCDKCDRDVTLTMTISQHEKGKIECPSAAAKLYGRSSVPSCLRHRRSSDSRGFSEILRASSSPRRP